MAGEAPTKSWGILTSSRAGSWWMTIFYTALACIEPLIALSRKDWWWLLIDLFFVLTAAAAWLTLAWVLRHPATGASAPPQARDRDDG